MRNTVLKQIFDKQSLISQSLEQNLHFLKAPVKHFQRKLKCLFKKYQFDSLGWDIHGKNREYFFDSFMFDTRPLRNNLPLFYLQIIQMIRLGGIRSLRVVLFHSHQSSPERYRRGQSDHPSCGSVSPCSPHPRS